jgi:rubrerythrin
VLGDIALFAPMVVLLELAVFFGKRVERRHTETPAPITPEMEKPTYTKCRFCGNLLKAAELGFCPSCGKSQV